MQIDHSILTYNFFLHLREFAKQCPDKGSNEWFDLSYQAFINYPLNNAEDLLCLIAFAYSWMPTMVKFKSNFHDKAERIVEEINTLKNINDTESFGVAEPVINNVIKQLVKIVNNSIVGTSKVLHFSNPNLFPILDSRVIKGWNKLMVATNQDKKASFSSYYISSTDKAIELYVLYTKNIHYWLKEIRIHEIHTNVRDVETYLYLIGK